MPQALSIQREPGRTCVSLPLRVTIEESASLLQMLKDSVTKDDSLVVNAVQMSEHDVCAAAILREFLRWSKAEGHTVSVTGAAPALAALLGEDSEEGTRPQDTSFLEQVGTSVCAIIADVRALLGFVGDTAHAFWLAARKPSRVRWRAVLGYMESCGTDALPIVVLICFLMGLILGFQAAVQMHKYGADIFVADLVGLSITKELGPLMVAMICTGRAGSAFAAEIGTMKVSEEVDALVTMGLDPSRFLVVPKVIALTLTMPLLAVFGNLAGVLGGLVVGMVQLDLPLVSYMRETMQAIQPWDLGEGLIKSAVFAVLVSGVGCLRGLRTEGGAQGVGRSTTSAVVSGIFLVVVFDTLLTILFTKLGLGT